MKTFFLKRIVEEINKVYIVANVFYKNQRMEKKMRKKIIIGSLIILVLLALTVGFKSTLRYLYYAVVPIIFQL